MLTLFTSAKLISGKERNTRSNPWPENNNNITSF